MARCKHCNNLIVIRGVNDHEYRYCSKKCVELGRVQRVTDAVPAELLQRYVSEVHHGACPKCGGPGPIDVHTSHSVRSLLVMTSTKARQQISCRRCGNRAKLIAALSSGIFGWWAFPWGFLVTPIQILRNVKGMLTRGDSSWPSQQLAYLVKLDLANRVLQPKV